jgi:hypothetical protein
MRIHPVSLSILRRQRVANMPDTARIYSFEIVKLPGGAERRGDEIDLATMPCHIAPKETDTREVATQEKDANQYTLQLPISARGIVAKGHLVEITSTEFGWTKHYEIVEPPQAYHTDEIVTKCFCVEADVS